MKDLIINNIQVKQLDNLYCLNDFHKLSGGFDKHKPANFMRLDQTKDLIAEINRSSDMSIAFKTKKGGSNQGTFVCKELIYSYAMWISAKFQLFVIRTFDNLVNEQMKEVEQELFHKERAIKSMSARWANDRDELKEFKEYHHQEIAKWQYEVQQMRKGTRSIPKLRIHKVDKYDNYYYNNYQTNHDKLYQVLESINIDSRELRKEFRAVIILNNILTHELREYQNYMDNMANKRITSTIYSHELVGLC
ncbi:KilA-N domain-containing protein [Candidatus Francisella endociliophora]|uniref:KilA-N domain-containing protein n=1 Tax=Candidatus Francisella endociliophora TaxID=653937 RepID=UPI00069398E3|nr:KilA-N domain-containing protein [Francisella sp. FSC1006]